MKPRLRVGKVIWGDDIGVHNISAYNHGIMGDQTSTIDRIATQGARFTNSYAEQSCTAERAKRIELLLGEP